jgi:hypothetical protein
VTAPQAPPPSDGTERRQRKSANCYWLALTHRSGDNPPPLRITARTPTELAQAVHHYVRGQLDSAQLKVDLDPQALTGTITQHRAVLATFTLTAILPRPDDDGIRHGYTLQEIDVLVRKGISRNVWYRDVDADERYSVGWHAAVELLYTTDEAPEPYELIRAAWRAADAHTGRTAEHRGVPRNREENFSTRRDMPRFHAYWNELRHTPSHETSIIEPLAREQIWPRLSLVQQAALQALADHRTYQEAADALGLKLPAFYNRVRDARRRFLRLWMEGETPRRGWTDRRVQAAAQPGGSPHGQRDSISAHIRRRKKSMEPAA